MDTTNQKIKTVSYVSAGIISAITLTVLLKAFAAGVPAVAKVMGADLFRHGFPAFLGIALFMYLQFSAKVNSWAEDVIIEVRKVVWPSRQDTTGMTIVVCIMIIISGVVISAFDFIAGLVVQALVK